MTDITASIPPILGDPKLIAQAPRHQVHTNPMLRKQDNSEPYRPMNKLEYLDLKIKMEEVHIIRREIAEALEDQKRFLETGYSEKNGRTRLLDTVMAQGVKLLDLFEEAAEHKIKICRKDKEIDEKKTLLYQKIRYREYHEEDNQNLRDQIAHYEATVAKTQAANNDKAQKWQKMNSDLSDAKTRHKKLTNAVQGARTQSSNLKTALASGFAELEKTLAENEMDV